MPTSKGHSNYGDTAVGPDGQVMVLIYQDQTNGQRGRGSTPAAVLSRFWALLLHYAGGLGAVSERLVMVRTRSMEEDGLKRGRGARARAAAASQGQEGRESL